jgi:hypothetical protein
MFAAPKKTMRIARVGSPESRFILLQADCQVRTLMMQQVLAEPDWQNRLEPEDL